uniref:40S ribosomal protein s5 n=1 Tax=Polytomella sp. Pringsheim 198.80 TaxID=37502 RepID=Q84VS6_9CHLO|nr:40S ribosomal protein s5 [Polytomella sp. Pringsheim 198.80]
MATGIVESPKLFGKYSFEDVEVSDYALSDYISVKAKSAVFVPHTAGRYQKKRFRKVLCPIVERLTTSLMMHGRNNGKKLMAVRIVKHAFDIIHLMTERTPFRLPLMLLLTVVLVKMLPASVLPVLSVVRPLMFPLFAVLTRLSTSSTTGAREAAFRNIKTIAECLADELMNAAKGSSNSYAIKKKDEIERVAKANR